MKPKTTCPTCLDGRTPAGEISITPTAAAVRPLQTELPDEPAYSNVTLLEQRDELRAALEMFVAQHEGNGHDEREQRPEMKAARGALARNLSTRPLQVLIEVTSGCAEVTTCPPGVEVEIIDHDNAKVGL